MNEAGWSDVWGPWPPPPVSRLRSRVKFAAACGYAAIRRLANARRGVAILTYHSTPTDRAHPLWQDFRGQMSLLEDLGYEVVPLSAVVDVVAGGAVLPRPSVALTFDDGWHDNLDGAFPDLARRKWPATVFIATSFVGRRPFMSRAELREAGAMGIALGNHTHTHPDVSTLSAAAIKDELRIASAELAEITGVLPRHFCYPFGLYDPTARDVVAASGFDGACASRYGLNEAGGDPFRLRRLLQEPGDRTRELRLRLAGGYGYLDVRQRWMDRPRRA